ncbi:MAG: hypothetical protein KBF12_10210 [Sebaldella sp.]|nr:hypothetical protein [Sebaldella sp.]
MKKISLFLCMMFSVISMSDFIDIGADDSSVMSLYTSIYVMISPSVFSQESSRGSQNGNDRTVEENYNYYKGLIDKENLTAKEIFSNEGLEQLKVSADDKVELTDTKIGLLVTNKSKTLALIPVEDKYVNVINSEERK